MVPLDHLEVEFLTQKANPNVRSITALNPSTGSVVEDRLGEFAAEAIPVLLRLQAEPYSSTTFKTASSLVEAGHQARRGFLQKRRRSRTVRESCRQGVLEPQRSIPEPRVRTR
jgi:hypothetical protein